MMELRCHRVSKGQSRRADSGFSLLELLLASVIFFVVSASLFGVIGTIQKSAAYQAEVQAVIDNTRIAMELVERHIRQAGNDPTNSGLTAMTLISPTEVRIQADLTGSAGAANPDKGDPDGDIRDSGEDVVIRYNPSARTIETGPYGGTAQAIANYISAFSMQYYDASGSPTAAGAEVRKVAVLIEGATTLPDPQTQKVFGLQLSSSIDLGTYQ
jgi:type II secretory pathway component PulJ